MNRSTQLGLFLCFVFFAVPSFSQQIPTGSVGTHIQGIDIPTIGGAPFTAKEVVTWNKPLVGGGTDSRKYYTMVARDSQGRVRREMRQFVRADSNAEPALRSFTILDPVSGTRTICTKATMSCVTDALNPNLAASGNGGGQSLGQRTIEGLQTTGSRATVSHTSGPRGSSRLAVSQIDSWFSPDLQVALSVTRTDPQSGVVTLNLTQVVQGEPDPSWFAVPSGYTVIGGQSR
jgi:hypothetical protein